MQNWTDTLAKQFLVCAEKALAGGAKHHWSWAQKGEDAESSLCPRVSDSTADIGESQQQFPEVGKLFAAVICKARDPVVLLCHKSKPKTKGLAENKESQTAWGQ